MSIIQRLHGKVAARIAAIAIAVSLLGFILMDAFTGRSRLFSGGNSTTLGQVNGKTIDEIEFEKRVQMQEQSQQQQQQGASLGEEGRQQIIASLWKQQVDQLLLKEEFDKLGIVVGKKEFADMLYTQPHQLARQYLGNPQTGEYDPNSVRQLITSIKRSKDKNQKDQLNMLLDAMENARLTEKYTGLVAGSIHYPKWLFESQNAENSQIAKISYVSIPTSLVPDSSKELAVSDKEIENYIDKHKDIYKAEDETRTIEYVSFSASPSPSDSAFARKNLLSLKTAFDTTKNMTEFIKANSELPFYDGYIGKKNIKVPNKDSIVAVPVGGIYGPYVDNDNYVLAKVLGVKQWADTVKVRHILINLEQQGQLVREDSTAKKLIDSIQRAIAGGANFDTLCKKYSEDQGSKDKGGIYDNVYSGQMVPPFNDFIFDHKVGEKGVVKTDFGYHYIEILEQRGGIEPAYKIAYLSKKIEASDETERNAESAALQFAGESRDQKAFDAAAEKNLKPKGIQKLIAPDINSHAYDIQGIGVSRKFIKEIFDADRGEVLQPERVGDNFIVGVVIEINKPGTLTAAGARKYVEPVLKNQKKVEILKKRIGKITTLEAVSSAMGQPVQTADSVRFSGGNNAGLLGAKVIGAVFNPANKGKVVPEPIEGNNAVDVIRVDNVGATVLENADINGQQKNLESQSRMRILMSNQYAQYGYGQQFDPAAVLRKAATIKDYRNRFY